MRSSAETCKQEELFRFVDSVQLQIHESESLFFSKWNSLIKKQLKVADDFCIKQFVDICGGYWLNYQQYDCLEPELKNFYDGRIKKNYGKIYLRGYDYYQVDPIVHKQEDLNNRVNLWCAYKEKWNSYQIDISFHYLKTGRISVENWLGTLGLLEYMFSDLTSLRWFEFKNKSILSAQLGDTYSLVVEETEMFTEIIGETIACVLKFDFDGAYSLLSDKYGSLIHSELLSRLINIDFDVKDKSSVRSVREGDSLTLIYASYLMKLEPFCRNNELKNIQLVSNAFGAMNIGIIMKHLIAPYSEALSYNILYAQNRAIEDVVYGTELLDVCCVINKQIEEESDDCQAVFIVDDSIFSGYSYLHIKDFLPRKYSVYLLPLTINCDCLKYCRRGIKETDDMYLIAQNVVKYATEVGDLIPTFCSFWDFERTAVENKITTSNVEFRSVLDGDDMLTKHLWAIFKNEIIGTN